MVLDIAAMLGPEISGAVTGFLNGWAGNIRKDVEQRLDEVGAKVAPQIIQHEIEEEKAKYVPLLKTVTVFEKLNRHWLLRSVGFDRPVDNFARALAAKAVEKASAKRAMSPGVERRQRDAYRTYFRNYLHKVMMGYDEPHQSPKEYLIEQWGDIDPQWRLFTKKEFGEILLDDDFEKVRAPYLTILSKGPGYFQFSRRLDDAEEAIRGSPLPAAAKRELRWVGGSISNATLRLSGHPGHGFRFGDQVRQEILNHQHEHADAIVTRILRRAGSVHH
ncbi:hypothetical protein HY995_05110 [Candidatus Micrarchaeota archaeon]|nr:hypothetical protein [Candidatus Micrarchaeota archaeon]